MTPFYKLSGGGNDFIALAEPDDEPDERTIRLWCRRGLSLGADGLFVLRRSPAAVELDYFNSDGRAADLCLNASRCAVRLAEHLGWAPGSGVAISTAAGLLEGRVIDERRVAISTPSTSRPQRIRLETDGREIEAWSCRVGVPHVVVFCEGSVATVDVQSLGREIRHHPRLGPEGANVDFVATESRRRADIRSFERGIEGETLACGTGMLAAAEAGLEAGLFELPLVLSTRGGFEFEVRSADAVTGSRRRLLEGDARLVAEGRLAPGAAC